MAIEHFDDHSTRPAKRRGRPSTLVREALEREIVLGERTPREGLLELELAATYGCSQNTVREALLRLAEDGLVVRLANRGTFVAECRRDDNLELMRIRHDIECRGVVRASRRYDASTRAALVTLIERMEAAAGARDEYALSCLDRRFHLRLYEEANLPLLDPMLRRCLVHNHRYKIFDSARRKSLRATARRHVAIVTALDTGDPLEAIRAISTHVTTIGDLGPSILPDIAPPERFA